MDNNLTISELNELTNDLMVARLTVDNLKAELESEMAKNTAIQELQDQIATAKQVKEEYQRTVLEAMSGQELKTWKTEQCTVSRAKRETVKIKEGMKDELKRRIKEGETFDIVELGVSEYVSIRLPK